MLLAIDIGNTTTSMALIDHKCKVHQTMSVDTSATKKYLADIKKAISPYKAIEKCRICSVVPGATKQLSAFLKRANIHVQVVGKDIHVPLKNKYRKPKEVGQDRLVGAFAAQQLYGGPAIIIDLGTAITFDALSSRGEYLGGAIVPGLQMSAESLSTKTALLPNIDIKAPRKVIGKDTQESILSGLFYGYGALCQGFIQQMSKEMRGRPKVIMTGGHTSLMKKFIDRKVRIIDEHLVFRGLALI